MDAVTVERLALAERMASWLATGSAGPDRPRRRATQDAATPWTGGDHAHPMDGSSS